MELKVYFTGREIMKYKNVYTNKILDSNSQVLYGEVYGPSTRGAAIIGSQHGRRSRRHGEET